MKGLMQDWPLLLSRVLEHAARWHGEVEIVTRTVEGPIHRSTYAELYSRSCQLANAVCDKLDVKLGDVVATMAWNTHRHMEIFYALMGQGVVVHTLNPRLFTDQLNYIINHAEDQWMFVDLTFVPLLEKLQDTLPTVKGYVIMTDAAHMPQTTLPNVFCYEELLGGGADTFDWPEFDENTASSMCYTSGTTGNPKGVLYSHRSHVLHGLSVLGPDYFGFRSTDTFMISAPMFHANAWAGPFMTPMVGCKTVMVGPKYDAASLYELLIAERVTMTAVVPTVLTLLAQYLDQDRSRTLPDLKQIFVGGSSCPPVLIDQFKEEHGIDVVHVWGMTETSPAGSMSRVKQSMSHLPANTLQAMRYKQGRPQFLVDLKITGDGNERVEHDGQKFGRLKVRGPAIVDQYYRSDAQGADEEGWFDSGDVATIDEWGFMNITDRNKDVIKSGGEWISSIELENVAMGCAGVHEAAAIGLHHPKWDERPLLVIVRKPNATVGKDQIMAHLTDKIAKWWLPDDVAFVDEIPHTATGKISKLLLRERFKDYQLPTA